MVKPDVFIKWPKNMDYPLFRINLDKMRPYVGEIYVALSEHHRPPNLDQFIRNSVRGVHFVESQKQTGDWCDNAVHEMLKESRGASILFLEQDFLIRDIPALFSVFEKNKQNPFIGHIVGTRIHPSFALIRTELLYLTTKDFAAHTEVNLDNYDLFFRELGNLVRFKDLKEFGFEWGKDFYHMGGLTQNYNCFMDNQPFYKEDEFLTYNHLILSLPINQDRSFLNFEEGIERAFGPRNNPVIKSFFPVNS